MIPRCAAILLVAIVAMGQTRVPSKSATYRIAGTVVSSVSGQVLAGVKVFLSSNEHPDFHREVTTSGNGSFAFPDLSPAKYSLTASAHGYRPQGFNQHGDYFTGIVVGPGIPAEALVFRLVPDGVIEGTVTDEDGDPVRNANVALFQRTNDTGQQRTQQILNAATDDRGHYQFGHCAPGTYFIAVSARPWYAQNPMVAAAHPQPSNPEDAARSAAEAAQLDVAYPMTFFPSAEDSSAAGVITLHPGERATADVTLRAVPAVHLRINTGASDGKSAVAAGRGFPRVSQRIFEGTVVPVMSAQAQTLNNSTFEYTGIAPGHYILEMPDPGLKRNGGGWFKEMDLSGTMELDTRDTPSLASVTGTLQFEGDAPKANVYIVLTNRTSGENFSAAVTANGSFDFTDTELRPGTYDVILNNAPHFLVKGLQAKGARVTGKTINITGGSVELAIIATHSIARIDGTVLKDMQPFAGAMVILMPRDPVADWTLFRRDQSDSDGTFTFHDVLPGSYTVVALQNNWDLDWASSTALKPYLKAGTPIEVTGDGRLNLKVQLQ